MKKDDHHLLGSLLKTTGIKGEIVLKFNDACSEEIQKLESIFIDVDNKLVPFFIEEIRSKSANTAVVKFKRLDEEEKSSEFIGLEFYVSSNQITAFQIESDDYIEVTGYQVFDQDDKLAGEVIEFIDIPENPLLNIKSEEGEYLIPVKDELIIEIDDNIKKIRLIIPDGLFDID